MEGMYFKFLVRPKPINSLKRNQVEKEKRRKKRSSGIASLTWLIVTGCLFVLPACGDDKPMPQEKKVEAVKEKAKKKPVKKAVADKKEKAEQGLKVFLEEIAKR